LPFCGCADFCPLLFAHFCAMAGHPVDGSDAPEPEDEDALN
jgi:hypothetical protein